MEKNVEPLKLTADEALARLADYDACVAPFHTPEARRVIDDCLLAITDLKGTLLIKEGALEIQGGELARAMEEHKRLREALTKLLAKWESDAWVTDQDEMAAIVRAALQPPAIEG
jgi:hypothetical protein